MEETVQVLFDEDTLVRDGGALKLTKPLNALKIPPTVQGILAARIDRLPSDAKELLQTLAVIGREFPISLIGPVWQHPHRGRRLAKRSRRRRCLPNQSRLTSPLKSGRGQTEGRGESERRFAQ